MKLTDNMNVSLNTLRSSACFVRAYVFLFILSDFLQIRNGVIHRRSDLFEAFIGGKSAVMLLRENIYASFRLDLLHFLRENPGSIS